MPRRPKQEPKQEPEQEPKQAPQIDPLKQLLEENKDVFIPSKTFFTPDEMALAYRIWNTAHAIKHGYRTDSGCSSCRRSIVQGVLKLVAEHKQGKI
jgi:hypothetical protein